MKISTNSRYALRFLARVAQSEKRLTTAQVALMEDISEKMLERIAAKLVKEGFITSVKGSGGGYKLAMPGNEITVTSVLQTMETPYLPHHCIENFADCAMKDGCTMLCLWERIDNAIRSVTDEVTIADIMRGEKQKTAARRLGNR